MKKIILFILLFCATKSFAQFPINAAQGTQTTTVLTRGISASDSGYWYRTAFADTTALNRGRIDEIAGVVARTSDNSLWLRNNTATRWIQLSGGSGSVNIYNSDGTQTGNRIVTGGGYTLAFDAQSSIRLQPSGSNRTSLLYMDIDSIRLEPPFGILTIDSLASGASTDSVLVWTQATGRVKKINASSFVTANAWGLTGNSGTTAGTNFVGTTDAQHFVFKVRDSIAGVIQKRLSGSEATGSVALGMYALKKSWSSETYSNIAIGPGAMQSFEGPGTAGATVAIGRNALRDNKYGYRNVIIGEYANSWGWGGEHNTIIGAFAGEVNSNSFYNTGVGSNSLRGNKQGHSNSALGFFSLLYNTTAVASVTITSGGSGYTSATCTFSAPETATPGTVSTTATGTVTVAAGAVTGITITNRGSGYSSEKGTVTVTINGDGTGATGTVVLISGEHNTVAGYAGLAFNTIGTGNVAIGREAGMGLSNAAPSIIDDNSVFIGYGASRLIGLSSETKLTNATAIGYNSKVGCSNCLVLGDTSLNTKVGIGTSTPTEILHVVGNIKGTNYIELTDVSAPSTPSSGFGRIYVRADSLRFKNDGGTEFTMGTGGGSSTSPAGNFGNLQINRNGAFATPASDSLDWESATGLGITGSAFATVSLRSPTIIGSTAADGTLTLVGNNAGASNTSSNKNIIMNVGNTPTQAMALYNSGVVHVGSPAYNANIGLNVQLIGNSARAGFSLWANNLSISQNFGYAGIQYAGQYGIEGNGGIQLMGAASAVYMNMTSGGNFFMGGSTTPTGRVHIAAGTASASTAPLKLTTGTSLTTAEAGAFEYTTPQLFFTNGAAIRQEIPQIQQARVSTQYDNTTTTLGTVTGLTTNVAAGKTYRFEAVLYTTSNVAGGVKFAMAGTATATNIIYEAVVIDNNVNAAQTRATALATTVGAVTAVTNAYAKITGTITVNAAGTFLVQAAANAAVGTTSVLVGSTFVITEML